MAEYSQGPIAGMPPSQPGYNNANTTMSSDPDKAFLSNVRPPCRPWLKFLPPLILVFTIGVIGMIGYVVNTVNDGSQSLGFNLFAGAWTLIVGTFFVLAFWVMPHIHYRWIIFILSALSCIWWLTAFAYLASNTRDSFRVISALEAYSSYASSYGDYGFKKRDWDMLHKRQTVNEVLAVIANLRVYKRAAAVMAGASAVGAIIWVIFCVFTVFYAISLFGSSSPSSASAVPVPPTVAAIGQGQKPETSAYDHSMYPPSVATVAPGANTGFAPGANTGFAPAGPGNTFSAVPTYNSADPRDPRMAPGAEFLTPPPPGSNYANPQFGGHEVDRNYTVSPLSTVEMPASQPPTFVEMPAAQR